MIRLLIADDHAIVRDGLKRIFAAEPDLQVVGEAVNGDSVLEWLARGGCDLLLLDLNFPGLSGADLIARIKADANACPILVLSVAASCRPKPCAAPAATPHRLSPGPRQTHWYR